MTETGFQDSEMSFLYVTVPDMEIARVIAGGAIREKLAACANVLPQMTAIYEWNGDVEEESELVVILKTSRNKAQFLAKWVEEHHPYEVPCILEIPLGRGNHDYVSWLQGQLGAGSRLM
ncbi:divalent-cation tolerance protein CutA [Thalassospira povalilytica]|uniref:divalent-cation tolerance protein CutA n=1 Tax=Thalassospira povalilytica TaxID=732237 RepID=UPI000DED6160|eukprot:NODE_2419_length_1069_cov_1.618896_g2401_i0.p1 GENE.NODE_2419_length_1069_cov_1.618896_g2401_i0~~NODE_2419_length_1069_cov_1.618896_g2401_i0.p1  ORF type:complete len:119 (+),score=8.63 NODE_2419_length_1069_cov_1.618896_g2401_i0:517-873(+)